MKIPLAFLIFFINSIILHADPIWKPDTPPTLSLSKAAEIAQTTLEHLKLPPEYFLKSIIYQAPTEKDPIAVYLASFEPSVTISPNKIDVPVFPKIKYIQISLDGTATVVEKERPSERKIIRPESSPK